MKKDLNELKSLLAEVADLDGAIAVLGWDQQTYMPPGGAESRGEQLGTLAKISHDKFTAPRVGELFEKLPGSGFDDLESDDARFVKIGKKKYTKALKVSSKWVEEFANVTTVAQEAWVEARAESNFSKFQPHLEKIIDLRKQYAEFFKPFEHIYDPLLDDYESGLKTRNVQQIFTVLRDEQVELLKAISSKPQVDNSFIKQKYDIEKQKAFGEDVITRFGYDWNCGRQDLAAHPFTTSFGHGDVRITTRFLNDDGASGLFSTMHEGGHAMYDQGIHPGYRRSPLHDGASMAIHESQSRMWENLVGRSRDFWVYFFPKFQSLFPEHLSDVSLDSFYKGINKVQPSLIRVEADEATYNLHIMLRLEVEIALMEGKIAVKDLPGYWNSKMQEYLGVTPIDDARGVLQDVHWSGGMVGYFPTYALGNLISLQLWEKINAEIPTLPGQIRNGNFAELLAWLRKNIHSHGAKFEPQELIQKVTGSKITPEPYIRYLKKKYSEIYGI